MRCEKTWDGKWSINSELGEKAQVRPSNVFQHKIFSGDHILSNYLKQSYIEQSNYVWLSLGMWMNSFCTSVTHIGCHGRFLSSFLHNMLRLRELIKPTRFRGKCLLEPVGQKPTRFKGQHQAVWRIKLKFILHITVSSNLELIFLWCGQWIFSSD